MASDKQDKELLQEPKTSKKSKSQNTQCCTSFCCAKVFCLIYGFVFFIVGIVLLGLGFYVYSTYASQGINDSLFVPSILTIIVGACTLMTAICGLLGAIRESPILLKIFLGIIAIMFIILLITGILAYVYREKVVNVIDEQLESALVQYWDHDGLTTAMDTVQRHFKCCGLKGLEDWRKNQHMNCRKSPVEDLVFCHLPPSCCPAELEESDANCGNQSRLLYSKSVLIEKMGFHEEGCEEKVMKWFESHLDGIGIAALACCMLHVIGMLIVFIYVTMVEDRVRLYRYHPWRNPHF